MKYNNEENTEELRTVTLYKEDYSEAGWKYLCDDLDIDVECKSAQIAVKVTRTEQ